VPPEVYEVLERWAGAPSLSAIEAFSSPLNHRIGAHPADPSFWFGSAFADVDAPFGGAGSFLSIDSRRLAGRQPALLLANPPFFADHMLSTERVLSRMLRAADAIALVVVPALAGRPHADAPHCAPLAASPLTRAAVSLRAGEHSFVSGVAHRRTRGFHHRRLSRHDTDVFVMSSARLAAAEVGRLCDGVRRAFGPPNAARGRSSARRVAVSTPPAGRRSASVPIAHGDHRHDDRDSAAEGRGASPSRSCPPVSAESQSPPGTSSSSRRPRLYFSLTGDATRF